MMLPILGGTRWRQDVVAVLLGATSGCLGDYAPAARVGSSDNPPAKPGDFQKVKCPVVGCQVGLPVGTLALLAPTGLRSSHVAASQGGRP